MDTKQNGSTAYASNPFTTTFDGIKKLFKYNGGTFLKVILFNIGLSILLGLSVVLCVVAVIGLVMQNSPSSAWMYGVGIPPAFLSPIYDVPAISLVLLASAGFLFSILLGALLQAIQFKLIASSAANKSLGFKDVVKGGAKRAWALVGFSVLMTVLLLAAILVVALPVLLYGSEAASAITILGLIVAIIAIYFGVRLTFAPISIVDEDRGPIEGLKRSFAITKGHFIETVAIGAVASIFISVPTIFFDLIGSTSDTALTVVSVLSGLTNLVIGSIVIMGLAQRFVQLRGVKDGTIKATKTHYSNYLAIVGFVVVALISNALSYQKNMQSGYPTTQDVIDSRLEELR